jgi:hypothetical protein
MRTALLLLLALALPAAASAATVWKWVDEKGITHYSDVAVPGATKLELSTGRSSSSSSTPPTTYSAPQATTQNNANQNPVTRYRDFEIWKPGNNENIVNSGGAVSVSIRLEPSIQEGHSLFLYMDGQQLKDYVPNSFEFQIQQAPRGTHTLVAVITDERGKALQQSPAVRFTVRQESVAQPPVGPALRPPPKPGRQKVGQNKLPEMNTLPSTQPTYAALHDALPAVDPATNLPVKPPVKTPRDPGPGK